MIVSGLKKGAVFEDGGLFYVVTRVLDDGNYVSRNISEKEKEEIESAKKKEPTKRATRTKGA
jgi:hypothetical protein